MKSINLYTLSIFNDANQYTDYYCSMANCEKKENFKEHEIKSLKIFVDYILEYSQIGLECFNDFFYGFIIPQIGKEFDILKIDKENVLNVELKSEINNIDKAKEQLVKNKFYLSHLDRNLYIFLFDCKTKILYRLSGEDEIKQIDGEELISVLNKLGNCLIDNIEKLFAVSQFLVSPLNTPKNFLNEKYFLTLQQQEIKKDILSSIQEKTVKYFELNGGPGTGKTLLTYDIAKQLAKKFSVCVIHCGYLSEGHNIINDSISNLKILSASEFKYKIDLSIYDIILIDETHRFRKSQFEKLINQVKDCGTRIIFSLDDNQTLSKTEKRNNIKEVIHLLHNRKEYNLSERVRTNVEIAAFIKNIFDLSKNSKYTYENVEILFANNVTEAKNLIEIYKKNGFVFINHTPSLYNIGFEDQFDKSIVTHSVLGQEFDKVLVTIDSNFKYTEEGLLVAKPHPNPDFLYVKLLFQELTRVRENLCVLVVDNVEIFKKLLSVKTKKIN